MKNKFFTYLLIILSVYGGCELLSGKNWNTFQWMLGEYNFWQARFERIVYQRKIEVLEERKTVKSTRELWQEIR